MTIRPDNTQRTGANVLSGKNVIVHFYGKIELGVAKVGFHAVVRAFPASRGS